MKKFDYVQIEEAYAYANSGGQALHLHKIINNPKTAPSCFVREVKKGNFIAHLFDRDEERLIETAKKLGVRVIEVECRGSFRQHIDLCAGPLKKATALCKD